METPDNPLQPDQPDRIRQISKRKVIYVDLDEEIPSIFERIAHIQSEEVFLVVPQRAALLQSIVNLKILQNKVTHLGKTLSIITNDPVGRQLALQASISVFDEIRSPFVVTKKKIKKTDSLVEPLPALSNELVKEQPERLSHKKMTILDIVQKSKDKHLFQRFKTFLKERQEREWLKGKSTLPIGAPSRKTLGTLIVASLCILFVISYIALPGATITITPQSNVIEQSANLTLLDSSRYGTDPSIDQGYGLATYAIDLTLEQSLMYTSTGQIFDGTNASGIVTFTNEREAAWPLVAFSRIQSENGLVFRTQESVTIPGATPTGFGTLDVFVIADELDAYGRVIGERGNIVSTSFFLPGLRESSRSILYARNAEAFTGGSTVVTLKITQEDLDASYEVMKNKLYKAVNESLQAELSKRNELNGTDLALLNHKDVIELSEPTVKVPTQLLEAIQDEFEVTGSLRVSAVAYDDSEMVSILKEILTSRKSPDKVLMKVNSSSLSYEIFEVNKVPGQIRLTATIKGIEAYSLDPTQEHGAEWVKKIKEHVAGKTIQEAEDYIQNLPEVNRVSISSWPVWAPTIPTVFENIEVEMDEKWMEQMGT